MVSRWQWRQVEVDTKFLLEENSEDGEIRNEFMNKVPSVMPAGPGQRVQGKIPTRVVGVLLPQFNYVWILLISCRFYFSNIIFI